MGRRPLLHCASVILFILGIWFLTGFLIEERIILTKDLFVPGWKSSAKCACELDNLHLVIVVITRPENRLQRNAIRSSWGHTAKLNDNMTIIFLVGQSKEYDDALLRESYRYRDLVINAIEDTYENLTLKILSAFIWINR
jgi:hypothetical protein